MKILCAECDSGIDDQCIKNLLKLKQLNVTGNKKLQILIIIKMENIGSRYQSGIDDQGIKDLVQFEKLYLGSNKKIKNINHLTKVKIWPVDFQDEIR